MPRSRILHVVRTPQLCLAHGSLTTTASYSFVSHAVHALQPGLARSSHLKRRRLLAVRTSTPPPACSSHPVPMVFAPSNRVMDAVRFPQPGLARGLLPLAAFRTRPDPV